MLLEKNDQVQHIDSRTKRIKKKLSSAAEKEFKRVNSEFKQAVRHIQNQYTQCIAMLVSLSLNTYSEQLMESDTTDPHDQIARIVPGLDIKGLIANSVNTEVTDPALKQQTKSKFSDLWTRHYVSNHEKPCELSLREQTLIRETLASHRDMPKEVSCTWSTPERREPSPRRTSLLRGSSEHSSTAASCTDSKSTWVKPIATPSSGLDHTKVRTEIS